MTPLEEAIKAAGGQTALGKLLGVKQQLVWHWLRVQGQVPAKYCRKIQEVTGVLAEALRPDIFGPVK